MEREREKTTIKTFKLNQERKRERVCVRERGRVSKGEKQIWYLGDQILQFLLKFEREERK